MLKTRLRRLELELRVLRFVAVAMLVFVPWGLAQAAGREAARGTTLRAPLRVVDAKGRPVLEVVDGVGRTPGKPALRLLDSSGHTAVLLDVRDGGGAVRCQDAARPKAVAALGNGDTAGPNLLVTSRDGSANVFVAHDLYGGPLVFSDHGQLVAGLGYDGDGGRILLKKHSGATLFVRPEGR